MGSIHGTAPDSYRAFCKRCGVEHALSNDARLATALLQDTFDRIATEPRFLDVRNAIEESRGKMVGALFGVDGEGRTRVLMAFSGDLLGRSDWDGFVPSIFRRSETAELEAVTLARIAELEREISLLDEKLHERQVQLLKEARRRTSSVLMTAMFDSVRFTNASGVRAALREVFAGGGIPSGTGECAVPKLLNAANVMRVRPVAIAEAWWGPALNGRTHGAIQLPCERKCMPILGHLMCARET